MKNKQLLVGAMAIAATAAGLYLGNGIFNGSPVYSERTPQTEAKSADQAFEHYKSLRLDENGTYNEQLIQNTRDLIMAQVSSDISRSANAGWIEEGPDNIGGRTRAICIDNTNQQLVWAGSVSGGLFASSNGGNNWGRVDNFDQSLAISAMGQTLNGRLYVGTGFNGAWGEGFTGAGLFFTDDHGATWGGPVATTSSAEAINEIIADPVNPNKIWIATSNGLKEFDHTVNASPVLNAGPGANFCYDVKVSVDGQVVVCGVASAGVRTYVSTNAGGSFTNVSGSGSTQIVSSSVGRIEYAISFEKNTNNNYNVYASAVTSGGMLKGIFASEDNGLTWSEVAPPSTASFDPFRTGQGGGQGTYDNVISSIPGRADMFLVGGIDVYAWEKAPGVVPTYGQFEQRSLWFASPQSPIYVHADNHEMEWDESGVLYVGNDGGIGKSPDKGNYFFPCNRGYNVTQFYGIGFSADGDVIGGAQDNGSLLNTHDGVTMLSFNEVRGGDGFDCDISHINEDVIFASVYTGDMERSDDGGNTFAPFFTPPTTAPFHTVGRLYENPNDVASQDSVLFINGLFPSTRLDTANGTQTLFTGTVPGTATNVQIEPGTLTIKVGSSLITDDGAGNLTGAILSANGTINYTSGAYSFTTSTAPAGGTFVNALSWGIRYNVGAVINYESRTFEMPLTHTVTSTVFSGDTITLQDRVQSLYAIAFSSSDGINLTREALRFSVDPVMVNVVPTTSGTVNCIEFSHDGEHMYAGTSAGVLYRVSGLSTFYSPAYSTAGLTTTVIYDGASSIEGIAVDMTDPEHVIICHSGFGSNRVMESLSAASAGTTGGSGTFTSVHGNLPNIPVYDGVINVTNTNQVIVGTEYGVYITDNTNGGSTSWTFQSQTNGPWTVPVYSVRQQWRDWNDGTNRPGEIYIGTFGRGIWKTADFLGVNNPEADNTAINKLSVEIYPNPMVDAGRVAFELREAADVTIRLYNLSGQVVRTISLGDMTSGKQSVAISVADLATGTYIINVQAGQAAYNGKLIVSKQ